MRELSILIAAFLGLVLLYASYSKARQLSLFASQIASFRIPLVPSAFTALVARLTVLVEALLGGALLLVPHSPFVALATVGLFLFMLGLILLVWVSKRNVSCFCFGEDDGAIGVITISRNVFLAVLAYSYWSVCAGNDQTLQGATWDSGRILLLIYAMTAMFAFLSLSQLVTLQREMGMSVR